VPFLFDPAIRWPANTSGARRTSAPTCASVRVAWSARAGTCRRWGGWPRGT